MLFDGRVIGCGSHLPRNPSKYKEEERVYVVTDDGFIRSQGAQPASLADRAIYCNHIDLSWGAGDRADGIVCQGERHGQPLKQDYI